MGRKRADVWGEFDEGEKEGSFKARRVRCRHCGREFTAHANRMKEHLRECSQYKEALYKGLTRPIDLSSSRYDIQRTQEISPMFSLFPGQDITGRTVFKMGIVGGGIGSVMGPLHVTAATLGRRARLVCGCFSSDPQKSKVSGSQYNLHRNRIYKTYEDMIQRESELPESERMNFICIATPSSTHYSIASLALEHGFHVMCETPLCLSEEEAVKLSELATEKNLLVAMSYPYSCFGMIRYARDLIYNNSIGDVISIRVNYFQNAGILERDTNSWKMNSVQAGISYCFSDLGLQAYQLARYVTQMTPSRVSACLARSYNNRIMDDNGTALVQMKEGAFCHISVSKMSLLHDNDLQIEVDGLSGSIHWDLRRSNELIFQRIHMNRQILTPDSAPVLDHLRMRYSRLPFGHAEGFTEAMSNMYDAFFNAMDSILRKDIRTLQSEFTSILDGIEGVIFLNRAMESTQRGSLWTDIPAPTFDSNQTSVPSQLSNVTPMSGQSIPSFNGTVPVINGSSSVNTFPVISSLPSVSDIRSMNLGIIQPVGGEESSISPTQPASIITQM